MEAGLFLCPQAKGEGVESVSTLRGRLEGVRTVLPPSRWKGRVYSVQTLPSRTMQAVPKEWKGSKRIATLGREQQMLLPSVQSHAGHHEDGKAESDPGVDITVGIGDGNLFCSYRSPVKGGLFCSDPFCNSFFVIF